MSDEKVISKKAADLIIDYGDARQEASGDFGVTPDEELDLVESLKALTNYVSSLETMVQLRDDGPEIKAGGEAVEHYKAFRDGAQCELCRGTGKGNGEVQGGER